MKISFAITFVIISLSLIVWVLVYISSPVPPDPAETSLIVGASAGIVLFTKWIASRGFSRNMHKKSARASYNVFLSYASADSLLVQELQDQLAKHGLQIWRDKDNLYGGQQWPKMLGEAIADSNALLLIWSNHAVDSQYVEMEWCTAVALKKPIIPCWLDDTELPASLRSLQAVDARKPEAAVSKILSFIQSEKPGEPAHDADVIRKLAEIPFRDPERVLQFVKTSFKQGL